MKILSILAILVASTAAAADFKKTIILNVEGEPFTYCAKNDTTVPQKCLDEKPLTLERVVLLALQTPEQGLAGPDQIKRSSLAIRIFEGRADVLTADEIKLIKDLVIKLNYNPIVLYRVFQILDPASVAEK